MSEIKYNYYCPQCEKANCWYMQYNVYTGSVDAQLIHENHTLREKIEELTLTVSILTSKYTSPSLAVDKPVDRFNEIEL